MRPGYDYTANVGCVVLEGGETAQEVLDIAEEYEAILADRRICVRPPGIGMMPEHLTEEFVRQVLR